MSVKSKRNASGVSLSKQINRKKKHSRANRHVNASRKHSLVNWHEAASCALQIELGDYSDRLEYVEEYSLGKNYYRIDLLVIKKLTEQVIPKNIALIFKSFNLFEIKGLGSTLGTDAYYKTIGYAGLLIDQTGEKDRYSCLDVSLSFLSLHYPRKLLKHLRNERNLDIEKIAPGVYHINKETFSTQIIVTKELPPEDNLYLHFLTDRIWNGSLAEQLADDYKEHQGEVIYMRYLHQITTADRKGDAPMYICEGLLNLCGTSSEEIIERTKREEAEYYQPKIDRLSQDNKQLSSDNKLLSSEIKYLKSLLQQNNIPFNTEKADGAST